MSVRARGLALVVLAGGVALFAWTIKSAGRHAVAEGVGRLGSGFAVVLALGGLRHLARTVAWRRCLDDPRRLPLRTAFAAWLAGNALGTVTPFGLLISEPSKIVLLPEASGDSDAIAALGIENLFYGGTVVLMLAAGTAAFLSAYDPSSDARLAVLIMLAVAGGTFAAAVWVVFGARPGVSAPIARIGARYFAGPGFEARRRQIASIEARVFAVRQWPPSRVLAVLALEAAFHGAAIAEVWFVVAAITGTRPGLLTTFVLEYVNRTITIVFQFVPMWIGVDEAASASAANVLMLAPATGVSLALIRKARVLCWTAVGLALGARRMMRSRTLSD